MDKHRVEHVKPSMSTLYFRELEPRPMVQLFAKHGWEYLELSECHAYDLVTQGRPLQVGGSFRQFAADHGISFLQGHLPVVWYAHADRSKGTESYFNVAPENDLEWTHAMDAVKRWVELFDTIGIRYGVLHMGGSALKEAGWSDKAIFEHRVKSLSEIVEYAQGGGITICLENLSFPNCGVETLEEIRALIVAVDADNLAICVDTGHLAMAGLDCVEFVLEGGSLIKALHIHDNIGTLDDHVLPYERKTIPWNRVLAVLPEVGYNSLLNMEIPGRAWCPMPVREARLRYAKELGIYMAELISH
jgi:sugar phosphate isomerase/epimerase